METLKSLFSIDNLFHLYGIELFIIVGMFFLGLLYFTIVNAWGDRSLPAVIMEKLTIIVFGIIILVLFLFCAIFILGLIILLLPFTIVTFFIIILATLAP